MRRGIAVTWHLVSFLSSVALYFFFVLPRWPELMGDTSHTLGTVLRIATGALVGLTALPVVFTLLHTRRPEFGTPQLALSLRLWSIIYEKCLIKKKKRANTLGTDPLWRGIAPARTLGAACPVTLAARE